MQFCLTPTLTLPSWPEICNFFISAQRKNSNFFPTIFLSRLINALSYALTDIFKFSAIKIWESVPPEFKRFPYMLFKKRYKRFLLSPQNWPYSLTVSYIRYCFTTCSFPSILTCIYVCLSSLTITISSLM